MLLCYDRKCNDAKCMPKCYTFNVNSKLDVVFKFVLKQ